MTEKNTDATEFDTTAIVPAEDVPAADIADQPAPKEIGGPKGPEPTRYGDWEVKGRCIDF